MTYQTSDEEVNLLESQSDVNVPIKSTSNYAKAAIAGAISLILIVAFTINQPAQIPNISNSFSNLKSVFGNVVNKNTIDFGNGDIAILDRHPIDCGNLPIKGFTGGATFNYQCYSMNPQLLKEEGLTNNPTQHGSIAFLDRQRVSCPDDYLLSKWHLNDNGWWGVRISYTCVKYKAQSFQCQQRSTDLNEVGDGIRYLDRHRAYCNDNEAMKEFHAETQCMQKGWFDACIKNGFQWKFTCCSAEEHEPTKSPVAHPTEAPTEAPIQLFVGEPTNHPITEPTYSPIVSPTMSPNKDLEVVLEKEGIEEELHQIELIKDAKAQSQKIVQNNQDIIDQLQAQIKEKEKEGDAQGAAELANRIQSVVPAMEQAILGLKSDGARLAIHEENIVGLKIMQERRDDAVICPFTFLSGITDVKVPSGCTLFAVVDINHHEQFEKETPAIFACVDIYSPIDITQKEFEHYGLVKNGKSLISMIQPGSAGVVEFFDQDNFQGNKGTFSDANHKPLFQHKYAGSGQNSNDNVFSALVKSTDSNPIFDCKNLEVDEKLMKLNEKLMIKPAGKIVAPMVKKIENNEKLMIKPAGKPVAPMVKKIENKKK